MAVLRKTGRVPPLYCLRVGRKEGKERKEYLFPLLGENGT